MAIRRAFRISRGLRIACTSLPHRTITPFGYGTSIPYVPFTRLTMCGTQKSLLWKGLTSKVLKGHTSYVFCVNYNTEGTQLVSGGCDGDIKIWNAGKGEYNFVVRSRI